VGNKLHIGAGNALLGCEGVGGGVVRTGGYRVSGVLGLWASRHEARCGGAGGGVEGWIGEGSGG
jgi:hypothetical protein